MTDTDKVNSNKLRKAFSYRLRVARITKGLNQAELAELLNDNPKKISKYETCRNFPRIEKLIEMADALDVSLDFLLGRGKIKFEEE